MTTIKHEIRVALVGGGSDSESFDEDCDRAYEDRAKVTVMASGSDSLATVLSKATAQFRVTHPGDYTDAGRSLDFYRGNPRESVTPTLPATTTVTITTPGGLAVWHVRPEDASIADLVLAHERKVFQGDPLRPYLLIDPHWRMGGLVPGGWDMLIWIWGVLVYVEGSWGVLKRMVRVSKATLEVLDRAAGRWERHRKAALFARTLFEARGADIMDVIETARAAATYQLEDLMAWSGIEDPAVAADIAGWAGYKFDAASQSFSEDPEEGFADLVSTFPINLSAEDLPMKDEAAHREVMLALAEYLVDRGLAEDS